MTRRKVRQKKRNRAARQPGTPVRFDPKQIFAKTNNQQVLIDAIRDNYNSIVLGAGPAGCGKSFLSIGLACQSLRVGRTEKIIISRPLVGAGEDSGALPGNATEKIRPYLQPLFDELKYFASSTELNEWQNDRLLEIVPIQFMRGRTFKNSFIIIDEAQNATFDQLKMVMSRLGEGSKMVIEGDPDQTDLPRGKRGGFADCLSRLGGLEEYGLQVVKLTEEDIVRHVLVGKIMERLK